MESWKLIVSICASTITILTVLEKLGITGGFKKIEREFNELKKLNVNMSGLTESQEKFGDLQKDQNTALLALLRNDLYQSFKTHRHHQIWTDDECTVQTKLHQAYRELHGNGEEELWWEKKKSWTIVSEEEFRKIVDCPKDEPK